jgi:hypothetical protein
MKLTTMGVRTWFGWYIIGGYEVGADPNAVATNRYYDSAHWRALRSARLTYDGHRCTVEGCGQAATTVDHIETRPPIPYPCPLDRLDNLRSLCSSHDSQVKELRRGAGQRRNGGVFRVKGCDADGWPRDPAHR